MKTIIYTNSQDRLKMVLCSTEVAFEKAFLRIMRSGAVQWHGPADQAYQIFSRLKAAR